MLALLEIACFNEQSARIAAAAGADRIELCVDYPNGGTTPPLETVATLVKELSVPIFVMIRPRPGNFIYTSGELETMCANILAMKEAGAAGFVFGALTVDRQVDNPACLQLLQASGSLPSTFHRAFDTLKDPRKSMEQLISLGFQRILTSGGAGNAIDNLSTLLEYVLQTNNRICILPGGGVRPDNIVPLLQHTRTKEIHSAALHQPIAYNTYCDPTMIRRMKQLIKEIPV